MNKKSINATTQKVYLKVFLAKIKLRGLVWSMYKSKQLVNNFTIIIICRRNDLQFENYY